MAISHKNFSKLFKIGKYIYTFGQKGSNQHNYINHIMGPTLPPHLRFCRSHCKQKRITQHD
jgi:hypothetical protein